MSLCDVALDQLRTYFSEFLACSPTQHGYYILTTPLLYPDRDHIQLYLTEQPDNRYLVSDFGQTMMKLSTYGFEPGRTPRRRAMLFQIITSMGVRYDNGRFYVIVSEDQLGAKTWDLLSAVHKAADLVFTVTAYTKATFADEFENFIAERQIQYERGKQLPLPIGTTESVDFWINHSDLSKAVLLLSASSVGYAVQRSDRVYRTFSELRLADFHAHRLSVIDDRQDVWDEIVRTRLSHVSTVLLWTDTREVEHALRSPT